MLEHGHEQVVLVADRAAGLRAVIAIHSTALGPSLGGIRFWRYATEDDAMRDALALSEAMTWKASLAGLHQGGGKAVVLVDDPEAPHPAAMLTAFGRAIDELASACRGAQTRLAVSLLARLVPEFEHNADGSAVSARA